MPDRKVLLTGATGYVASQLLPTFREQYNLSLVDVRGNDQEGREVADVAISDLSAPELGAYAHLFKGQRLGCPPRAHAPTRQSSG